MRVATYVKMSICLLMCFISFQSDAQWKKGSKKKAKSEKAVQANSNARADSVKKATANQTPVFVKKQEEVRFAQLVVSFSSRGAGIDANAKQQLLDHITWFNTQNHCELMFDKKTWGREGEIDFCFFGNNQILIPNLYKQLKEKFKGKPTVFVQENFPCK